VQQALVDDQAAVVDDVAGGVGRGTDFAVEAAHEVVLAPVAVIGFSGGGGRDGGVASSVMG